MEKLNARQQEKLDRVNAITGDVWDPILITDARTALAFAMEQKMITTWTDFGGYYTFAFSNSKQTNVIPSAVGEAVVDKFLQLKDPLKETLSEKTTMVEEPVAKEITRKPKARVSKEV